MSRRMRNKEHGDVDEAKENDENERGNEEKKGE